MKVIDENKFRLDLQNYLEQFKTQLKKQERYFKCLDYSYQPNQTETYIVSKTLLFKEMKVIITKKKAVKKKQNSHYSSNKFLRRLLISDIRNSVRLAICDQRIQISVRFDKSSDFAFLNELNPFEIYFFHFFSAKCRNHEFPPHHFFSAIPLLQALSRAVAPYPYPCCLRPRACYMRFGSLPRSDPERVEKSSCHFF